jgi:alpha-galactosidase
MDIQNTTFASIIFPSDGAPTARYTSGLTVYDEALIAGRWVGRYWTGKGFIERESALQWVALGALAPATTIGLDVAAFQIEIDGQSLHYGWELLSMNQQPAARGGVHGIVSLRSTLLPVDVQVHTETDGTGFLTRWLRITNRAENAVALGAAWPWCGVLLRVKDWQALMAGDETASVFSVSSMAERLWYNEGAFEWQPLPNAALRLESRSGKSGHGNPFFVVRNEATGEHVVGGIAWSGNWAVELTGEQKVGPDAFLHFRAGPVNPAPQRVIDPGETVDTPPIHLGVLETDFDGAIQAWHRHLRRSVLRSYAPGRENRVLYNHWSYTGDEMTEERLRVEVDAAADLGSEVFVIDAGWYGDRGSNWFRTVGDWQTGDRLPNGLEPVFAYARQKGLLCGLWFDLERIGDQSRIAREHPEWLLQRYGHPSDAGDMDLTNPAALAYVEQALVNTIERYQLDLFRLDYNAMQFEGGQTLRAGRAENSLWRYHENIYGLYERIAARYPNLLMENCSGGGGRTDLGMLSRFHYTWVSDWQNAPRSLRIVNGMSMALPPECVDRNTGVAQDSHTRADLDFQLRACLFGHLTLTGFYPNADDRNPDQLERVRHHVALYKDFIRPFLSSCRVYHHTPVLKTREPHGWAVLEQVAEDQSRAVVGVFRLAGPADDTYLLRMRGVAADRRYKVTFGNSGKTFEMAGAALLYDGLPIRLARPLTSELLVLESA